MRIIKTLSRAMSVALLLCYLIATIFSSNLWGNLLSPIVTLIMCIAVFKAFYLKSHHIVNRAIGLFLSISLFSFVIADILWAICDLIFHIDPEEVAVITYCYGFTNVFLAIALSIYGLQILRKWNIIQMLIDSIVMSFFVFELLWSIFLREDMSKLIEIWGDPISFVSILLDVLIANWIIVWFVSFRSGKLPLYIHFVAGGVFLYSIVDLIYYYQYIYGTYKPNSLLDAAYVYSFCLMAIAALLKIDSKETGDVTAIFNVGRKGKAYALLLAPALLIMVKDFDLTLILSFISVILLYNLVSTYIQTNIYRETLLKEEKELNSILEQKVRDRTEELEENNRVLQKMIDQDYITGLYNRRYLLAFLEKASLELKEEETIALLYIDMNRYKMITTMFGHPIGEKILSMMASKIKPLEISTKNSILSAYGEDTFVFAAVGPYDYTDAYAFAKEVIRLSSDIYHIDGYQIRVTSNIGISIFPYDAITMEDLFKHADIAMIQARAQGFNVIQEFDLQLSEVFVRKSTIEIMLKKANFGQEFMVYYQPQLETGSTRIIGFEALLRWKTANGEFISPSEFIPVAEETGYIIPIGEWVMKAVMKQLVDWNNRFREKIMIGINVSLKQLTSAQFAGRLKEEMERLNVKPEWVDLEITESLQLQENIEVIKLLEEIRLLGVKVSIDDFGTGYSSLSYFKGLPADRIKLPKELTNCIHKDDFDYQLVKSIIQLSRAKGIKVIAEGVETKEQWETLKELQCDEVQGFYFGRPVSAQDIEEAFGDALFGSCKEHAPLLTVSFKEEN